jgi:hypothetical protein
LVWARRALKSRKRRFPARAVFDFVCLAKASPGGESIVHERDVLLKFAASISPGTSLSFSTNLH